MSEPDGHRYMCHWLENSLTVHCDGNVSCGLDDPHAARSYGNVKTQSLADIYANPEIERVRDNLWAGRRCSGCQLFHPVAHETPKTARPPYLPATLVIEPTVQCNLLCTNTTCDLNNDRKVAVRDENQMKLETFRDLINQAAPALQRVYFFNYGESFVNRHAGSMLEYLREECPDVRVISSTNGIPLSKPANARSVVDARLDELTFTISGVTQGSYERYHIGGKVDQALLGMRNVCDMRAAANQQAPHVEWRYLAFNFNDSEAEIDAAIALANVYGVNKLTLYLTNIPREAQSFRLAPGTRLHQKYAAHISFVHGFSSLTPDINGLWDREYIPFLGAGKWTSWRARMSVERAGHWLQLRLSGRDLPEGDYCYVVTTWGAYKIPLAGAKWTEASFLIPPSERGAVHTVEVIAPKAFHPCDRSPSGDTRCLGVIVGQDAVDWSERQNAENWLTALSLPLNDHDRSYIASMKPFAVCVPEEPYYTQFRHYSRNRYGVG
jgi:hypothetical protein